MYVLNKISTVNLSPIKSNGIEYGVNQMAQVATPPHANGQWSSHAPWLTPTIELHFI